VRAPHWALAAQGNGNTYDGNETMPKSSAWLSDLRTGKPLAQYRGVKVPPAATAVAFGAAGRFAVLDGGVVTVWDTDRGEVAFRTERHEKAVGVRFSPAGKVLLLDAHNARVGTAYDAATGAKLARQTAALRFSGEYVRDVRRAYGFDPNDDPVIGKALANPRAGRLNGRAAAPKRLIQIAPHPGTALTAAYTDVEGHECAAISADGRRVACASARDGVIILDGTTLQEVWALKPPFPVVALEFTRDGSRLVGCDETGRLVVWGAPPKP
jgi:WD40 repeat protein